MSPSHQVRQTEPKSPAGTSLPTTRLATPMVALIVVLQTPAEHDQRDHVPDPLQRGPEVGELAEEVGAGERLQRVPDRDPQHGVDGHAGPGVRQQGAERHPGPDAIAPQDDRRQRDAGGRPDGGDARRGEGERRPELGGSVVGGGEPATLAGYGFQPPASHPSIRASLSRAPSATPIHPLAADGLSGLGHGPPAPDGGAPAARSSGAAALGGVARGLAAAGRGRSRPRPRYRVPSLTPCATSIPASRGPRRRRFAAARSGSRSSAGIRRSARPGSASPCCPVPSATGRPRDDLRGRGRPRIRQLVDRALLREAVRLAAPAPRPGDGRHARHGALRAAPLSRYPVGRAPDWIALPDCAQKLGPRFDSYRTSAAADDINDVRRALGLGRITLYGDSYGTFLSQSYAFRHPETLNALVLDSAYPVMGESAWYPSLISTGVRSLSIACRRSPIVLRRRGRAPGEARPLPAGQPQGRRPACRCARRGGGHRARQLSADRPGGQQAGPREHPSVEAPDRRGQARQRAPAPLLPCRTRWS